MTRLAGLGALALALPAGAADTPAYTSGWGSLLQGLFGLLIVLGLLYAFLMLLRRFTGPNQGMQGVVRIVGGVMLSPRERLVMVEVRDTWLLLGVASGQVNLIHSMPKPAAEELPPPAAPTHFAEKFAAMMRREG